MHNIYEFSIEVQKLTGKNIEFINCKTEGKSHAPTVSIELKLPNDKIYSGIGANKYEAKGKAIEAALMDCVFEKGYLTK